MTVVFSDMHASSGQAAGQRAGHRAGRARLRLPGSGLRRWHGWIMEHLRARGFQVVVELLDGARDDLPAALDHLLMVEQALYGGAFGLARMDAAQLPMAGAAGDARGDAPEVVIDLAHGAGAGRGAGLRALFDGAPSLAVMVDALLAGRAPELAVAVEGRVVALGLPAVEDFAVLGRAADFVLARMAEGLARLAAHPRAGAEEVARTPSAPRGVAVKSAAHVARHLAGKLLARLTRRLTGASPWPAWNVGWRKVEDAAHSLRAARRQPDMAQYAFLPHDGRRFFGDPFGFVHEGRVHVFVEEFPHATGKGIISAFTLDAQGRPGPVRPVLEADVHLSYPQVFAHDGDIWMIPETEQARQVRLYRCIEFPHRWAREAVLIADRALSDATVVRHQGRWWMFAAERAPHGSSWDGLAVFHAERLTGPWVEAGHAPVLLDAGAARPAGAMWHDAQGNLMRVAQDCRGSYGRGMAICRVARLDEGGFAQQIIERLGPRAPFTGLHTLNLAGGFELIDAVN